MTREKISEYDAVAANNTDVNGVNIAENCPPSGMNNMGREIMAALKRFQTGSDGDGVTVGGALVVSGSATVNTFNVDVISEKTSAAGVTVDGVLLKDNTVNKVAITAPATAATLTIANNKTLTANNSITLVGTDATTMTFPATSATIARTDAAQTFTGTQTFSGNVLVEGQLLAVQTPSISAVSWDSSADDYFFVAGYPSGPTNIHQNMRRCVINDSGVVQYYLDSLDSTKTISGGTAALDGSVGQVMVEIPKFYVKKTKVSNLNTWWVADAPLPGFSVHPAFIKNGVEVSYRYCGAYDACYLDATDGLYKSGLNLDDLTASLDLAADKLGSVSGIFPIVGATRAECRSLAANRGTGWRQLDFYLVSAIQLLYLVEYGTFNSQLTLGAGNTATTYAASSVTQGDNGGSEAGKSNSLGNRSTNITTGASSGSRATAFMSYRGIENWFGNEWNWVDGMNIGESGNYKVWVTNDDTDFADDTSSGYTEIGTALSTNNTFVTNILDISTAFIPSAGGGSSTTGLCDSYFVATGQRVALFGGNASDGANAGGFLWNLSHGSSLSDRSVGARLAF
jgi:hypothetical protein